MDKYLNDMLNRYFFKLALVGYARDSEVMRLMGVVIIEEMVTRDFRGFLTECDRKIIEQALYNLTGGCVLPYPKINDQRIMNKLHLGDISELASRVEELNGYVLAYSENNKTKQKQQDERLDTLEDEHKIEHPTYDEDDEMEYGAKRKPRDKGHVEKMGCRHTHCPKMPREQDYRRFEFDECECKTRRWR